MNSETIYEQIYNKLVKLIPDLENMKRGSHQISKASGYMDLYLNILIEEKEDNKLSKIISLTHYYKQNGDLVPDPDMTIRIYDQYKTAEALTYQDFFGLQVVYPTPSTVNINLKKQLNSFLRSWLNKCITEMDHKFIKLLVK